MQECRVRDEVEVFPCRSDGRVVSEDARRDLENGQALPCLRRPSATYRHRRLRRSRYVRDIIPAVTNSQVYLLGGAVLRSCFSALARVAEQTSTCVAYVAASDLNAAVKECPDVADLLHEVMGRKAFSVLPDRCARGCVGRSCVEWLEDYGNVVHEISEDNVGDWISRVNPLLVESLPLRVRGIQIPPSLHGKHTEYMEREEFMLKKFDKQVFTGYFRNGCVSANVNQSLRRFDDIYIPDEWKNRALEGDRVIVEIIPPRFWEEPEQYNFDISSSSFDLELYEKSLTLGNTPVGNIVSIDVRKPRERVGTLAPMDGNPNFYIFHSAKTKSNTKVLIYYEGEELPDKPRVTIRVDEWPVELSIALGHIVRVIGPAGDARVETEVILRHHECRFESLSDNEDIAQCLPSEGDAFQISKQELNRRLDLRHLPVMSIDPPGCTDIDDALSYRRIDESRVEIGVHIADVTHFVKEGTAMDEEAARRCTTVYLSDRRVDMLPSLLSSNLCSLRSDGDRLAMTVLWEVDANTAEIYKVSFHKSVIRSRASLMYSEAQEMIDSRTANESQILRDMESRTGVHVAELGEIIRDMYSLSSKFRLIRERKGALTLASDEVRFHVVDNCPENVIYSKPMAAKQMVEDYMLLANEYVAKHIYQRFPMHAVLRCHPLPPPGKLEQLQESLRAIGISDFDISSSRALCESLERLNNHEIQQRDPNATFIIKTLVSRCLSVARYMISGATKLDDFSHYGLGLSYYTHFTSPIRRYADVLVHRLLTCSLFGESLPRTMTNSDHVSRIIKDMNTRHRHAQFAGLMSSHLFTHLYLQKKEYVIAYVVSHTTVSISGFGLECSPEWDTSVWSDLPYLTPILCVPKVSIAVDGLKLDLNFVSIASREDIEKYKNV